MSAYKIIDLKNWKRAIHCEVFRKSMQPQYGVSFELDITNFLKIIREKGYSFTFSFVYIVSKCANECEEFRYRFQDGEVVLFDRIDTSFTYMDEGAELFKVVNVPMKDSLEEYVKAAEETVSAQKEYFTGPMGNDLFSVLRHALDFFYPCFPYLFREQRSGYPAVRLGEIFRTGWKNDPAFFRTGTSFLCGRHSYSQICGPASGLPE